LRPLLEQDLAQQGGYEIVAINSDAQAAANAGLGYLYAHHDLAAKLGRQFGADWVLVGQHGKPSFLYSYLMMQLIDVKSQTLAARYAIELKGSHAAVTQQAVEGMAAKLKAFIDGNEHAP
jgi:hypothetical protein